MKVILVTIILIGCSLAVYSKSTVAEFVRTYKYDASLKNEDSLSARLYFKKHSYTASWFAPAMGRTVITVKGSWHFSDRIKDFQRFRTDTTTYNELKKRHIRLAVLNYKGRIMYGLFGHMHGQPYFFMQKNASFFSNCSPATCYSFGPYEPRTPQIHSFSEPIIFIPSKK